MQKKLQKTMKEAFFCNSECANGFLGPYLPKLRSFNCLKRPLNRLKLWNFPYIQGGTRELNLRFSSIFWGKRRENWPQDFQFLNSIFSACEAARKQIFSWKIFQRPKIKAKDFANIWPFSLLGKSFFKIILSSLVSLETAMYL